MTTFRVGVFATEHGWRLAGPDKVSDFASRSLAVKAAWRLARLAQWRGAEVQVLVQEAAGEALTEASWPTLPPLED